jgi:hypothetical protein
VQIAAFGTLGSLSPFAAGSTKVRQGPIASVETGPSKGSKVRNAVIATDDRLPCVKTAARHSTAPREPALPPARITQYRARYAVWTLAAIEVPIVENLIKPTQDDAHDRWDKSSGIVGLDVSNPR